MSGDVGRKIGQALGGTIDVVIPGNGSKEGRYRRLKVTMNISKPLPKGNYEVKSGYYIANDLIDVGLQNDDGRASIGIVALDSLGNLLHAHGSPIQSVGKVMTAEAIAIGKALEYAISKG
uniref:RNase H type-1 domain-containing protein n=1 Tax=Solanum tuberosum TaxID=4113 RepID=M1DMB8_SOLTU